MFQQIKSTSYIQRMLTKSNPNGQLQMLQEEYERMNFLNESNIEMKMRQVRLNRLFKEIEQIKEYNIKRRHRLHPKVSESPKTKETQQLENWKKAKNLGQYFSQRNLREPEIKANTNKRKRYKLEEKKPETSVSKRMKYGNEIFNWNKQNIQIRHIRKEIQTYRKELSKNVNLDIKIQPNGKSLQIDRNIKSKQTTYPSENNKQINTISKINGKCLSSSDFINLQKDRNSDAKTSVLTLSENVHLIDLETSDEMHEAILIDDKLQVVVPYNPSKSLVSDSAVKNWQKLAAFVRDKFKMYRSKKVSDQIDHKTKYLNELNHNQLKSYEYRFEGGQLKSLDDKMFCFALNLPYPILMQNNKCLKTPPAEDICCSGCEEKYDGSKFSVGKLRRLFEHNS